MSPPPQMIPVSEPVISPKAKRYVTEALKSGWISSEGKFITAFEQQFAEFLGVKYATTVSNGSTALHLALLSLGIEAGDEVIIPDQTIISCALAAVYIGAKPVFVDVEPDTGNIDPTKIATAITPQTKAIMVVHLFGHPVDLDPILALAKKHRLLVIEDCAQAHGALYKGRRVGSFGDVAIFSFYSNKIITTGEGGMLVTGHRWVIDQANSLKNLAHKTNRRFYHEKIGYNYRLTNLQAALGLANLEDVDLAIAKKRQIAATYQKLLTDLPQLALPGEKSYASSVYWMYNVVLTKKSQITRDKFRALLLEQGVDSRTYFYPLSLQPILKHFTAPAAKFPVGHHLAKNGLYLPSGLSITNSQIQKVSDVIHRILD